MKKRVVILGCTGSIGTTAIEAIRDKKMDVSVVGLSAHSNEKALVSLAKELCCPSICLTGSKPSNYSGLFVFSSLSEMLSSLEADIVLNGIAGFSGLEASLLSLQQGFDIALANKESIVCGGSYLFDVAKAHQSKIIAVDSEHSALAELVQGHPPQQIESLILTGSGGPFRTLPADQFAHITVEQALAHPTWKMGKKISVDSATLANKALEVIEASYLFGLPAEKIEVVIHPQSVVHSMIRTVDGAVYAQMGTPDMTLPIVNALCDTGKNLVRHLDFTKLTLTFEKPDYQRFPLLAMAFSILKRKGSAALAFNAADEVAVYTFLDGRCTYPQMIRAIEKTLEKPWDRSPSSFEETLALDREARELTRSHL
ncbi:MAG TPA: 1-deoxy-D-xylulose-5-phosphate reductoisomerase [Sphaerochaeta sp.]|jgi:1-deoxy-D-xylulose-5-phosphate reductoisomerase|nr:1-deoxy-D-xylulose-5-phosphate reductoisomerase [Sphaerochaeta sp.]